MAGYTDNQINTYPWSHHLEEGCQAIIVCGGVAETGKSYTYISCLLLQSPYKTLSNHPIQRLVHASSPGLTPRVNKCQHPSVDRPRPNHGTEHTEVLKNTFISSQYPPPLANSRAPPIKLGSGLGACALAPRHTNGLSTNRDQFVQGNKLDDCGLPAPQGFPYSKVSAQHVSAQRLTLKHAPNALTDFHVTYIASGSEICMNFVEIVRTLGWLM